MPPVLRAVENSHVSCLNVLILDDERFDRHRLARLCSGLDIPCEVSNAATLATFTTALEQGRFDLIILDYQLPDGTGLDALHQVRMSAQNCTAGIIMVSGQGHDDIARQAREDGCSDYLTKDELTTPTFQRAVANALQKSDLTVKLENQTFRRSEVEALLEHFSGQCARDVKPLLSRMMRQVRDLRRPDADANSNNATATTAERYAMIEESCMSIWQFVVNLERHQGKTLFADLRTPLPDDISAIPPTRRKPPSPFSRITH